MTIKLIDQKGRLVHLCVRPFQQGGHVFQGQRDRQRLFGSADVGDKQVEGVTAPRQR